MRRWVGWEGEGGTRRMGRGGGNERGGCVGGCGGGCGGVGVVGVVGGVRGEGRGGGGRGGEGELCVCLAAALGATLLSSMKVFTAGHRIRCNNSAISVTSW